MNKILKLFEEEYVKIFFNEHILPQYPQYSEIKNISIYAHKKIIRQNSTYHVVIEYAAEFVGKEKTEIFPIFCTAHHGEPRIKVYNNLKYLWKNNFVDDHFSIPTPLYYSEKFNATFYQGITGENLYHYIKNNDRDTINRVVGQTAGWLAKLHTLKIDSFPEDQTDGSIKKVVPTLDIILKRLKADYPYYYDSFEKIYHNLYQKEDEYYSQKNRLSLVHGDAHPENIIIIDQESIAMIDFVDLSLTDFARDLGCFLQQLNYMIMKKIQDQNYANSLQEKFLKDYSEKAGITIDENLKQRINTYYLWTQMRTAIFFLLMHNPDPERAKPLINEVIQKLNITI